MTLQDISYFAMQREILAAGRDYRKNVRNFSMALARAYSRRDLIAMYFIMRNFRRVRQNWYNQMFRGLP